MIPIKWKVLVYGAVLVVSTEVAVLIYRYMKTLRQTEENQISESIFHHVLFFPEKTIPCRKHLITPKGCQLKNCRFSHDEKSSFVQLIRHVLKAKRSIDLCMFSITCYELAQVVLVKYRQGANVRIITDTEYMNLKGSQMHNFQEEGIAIRHNRSSYLMHHKFLIIDGATVVTGSFNWTQTAIIGNHENVIITNHPDVTQPYVSEFKKLWEKFSPASGDGALPVLVKF